MKKKVLVIIFAVLMVVAMVLVALNITDVVKDEQVGLSAVISTDAMSYEKKDNVDISVTVYNDTLQKFSNVDVQIFLPEELSEIRGNKLSHTIEVPSNSETTVTSKALAVPDENREAEDIAGKIDQSDATKSHKMYTLIGLIIIAVLLIGIVVCVIVTIKHSKKAIKIVCIILSVAMTVGIVPSAFFAYKDRDIIIYVDQTITVDGDEVNVVARVTKLSEKHSQLVKIDVGNAMYDSVEDSYYLFDEMPELKGSLYNSKNTESAVCIVEDENGKELLNTEFSPNKEFTIADFGMIVGVNTIRFIITHKDGYKYEKSFVVNNLCEKNMDKIDVDRGDNDNDGVLNFSEELYHTDPGKKDSDGDGLSDYQEMAVVGTDPKVKDTDKDKVKDSNEDTDSDGLTNKDEADKYHTNAAFPDSDFDGLSDKEEVSKTKTDPNKKDTDEDGKSDKWELDKGFDPKEADKTFPKNEGISEMESVNIAADGEAVITPIENDLNLNSNTPGYVGVEPFRVEMEDETEATITINYDASTLKEGEVPTLYKYNEETQDYEEVKGAVSSGGGVKADITEPGVYVLLNHRFLEDVWNNDIYRPSETDQDGSIDIVFVLDRSASMDSNDPQALRKEVTKNFISKLRKGKDRAAIVQFTSIGEVVMKMTDDKQALYNVVDSIENSDGGGCAGTDQNAGTNGSAGLRKALEEMEGSTAKYKYIIFLTDGKDTKVDEDYGDAEGTTGITKEAREKGIIIHTVGLIGTGEVDVELLKRVAEGARGNYYVATVGKDAEKNDELINVYEEIEAVTIDRQTDSNDDGISDYYTKMICEGKISTSGNIRYLFGDAKYDDVQKNADFDGDGLKNGDEIQVTENKKGVYLKLISFPYMKDSDNDGFSDKEENSTSMSPMKYNASGSQNDISWLTTDKNFISNDYLELYDSSILVEDAVFIGNAFFGSTFDQTTLYRKQLVQYFKDVDALLTKRNQVEVNHTLFASYAGESLELVKKYVARQAELGDFEKCKEAVEYVIKQAEVIKDTHSVIKDTVVENLKKLVDNFDKDSVAYFDHEIAAYQRHLDSIPGIIPDDCSEFYRLKLAEWSNNQLKFKGLKEQKMDSINLKNTKFAKYTKIADGIDAAFTALTIGMSAWDNYIAYCDALASLETVEENVYILDCIMNTSHNTYLYSAAFDLKTAIQLETEDQKSFLGSLSILDTTQDVLSEGLHAIIGKAGVPGAIIEVARTVLNLALRLDEKAEAAANTVALAETSSILAENFIAHLEGGYAEKYKKLWVAYSDYSEDFCNSIVNIVLVRKRAEENMLLWESKDEKKIKGEDNCTRCEKLLTTYEKECLKCMWLS